MQRLNLDKCEITTEHFIPNIIYDKNLYDDIGIETGSITACVLCDNNKENIKKAIIKYVMMLEAYNDGYVKAIGGERYGLSHVFCVVKNPEYRYCGGNNLEIIVNVASIMYNPYLRMTALEDCLAAGASTALMPDLKKYFDIKMSYDEELKYQDTSNLRDQIEPYRKTIMSNIDVQ